MIIGVNKQYQIKQIHDITDSTLTQIVLNETERTYPFNGWSDEKILCYCYKNENGSASIYPYINAEKIHEIEKQILQLQAQVIELEFEKIGGVI